MNVYACFVNMGEYGWRVAQKWTWKREWIPTAVMVDVLAEVNQVDVSFAKF